MGHEIVTAVGMAILKIGNAVQEVRSSCSVCRFSQETSGTRLLDNNTNADDSGDTDIILLRVFDDICDNFFARVRYFCVV